MRRYFSFIASVAAFLAAVSAQAQDLNPTVSVTNIYKGKVKDTAKWQASMSVPDSLYSFDYTFDYSVGEKAYVGGSEFTPYSINMRPVARVQDDKVFYVRAGAGYLLKPEFQLFYSPRMTGAARFNLSNDFRGFFGLTPTSGYHPLRMFENDGIYALRSASNEFYKGYDFSNDAKIDFSLDFAKCRLDFQVGDELIGARDTLGRRLLNGIDFSAKVKGKSMWDRYIYYDGGLDVRVARDNMYERGTVNEVLWGINATGGPVLDKYNRILVSVDVDGAIYRNLFKAAGTVFSMGMRYEMSGDRSFVSLGAGYDILILPKGSYDGGLRFPVSVFPDVKASYNLVKDAITAYANLGGGTKLNTYSSLARSNHHFDASFAYAGPQGVSLLQASREMLGASAGLKGQVFSSLTYDLSASFDMMANSPMTSVTCVGFGTPSQLLDASIFYIDYNLFHADAQIGYIGSSVKADLGFRYQRQMGVEDEFVFALPEYSGSFDFIYNWHQRLHAGVSVEAASIRKGNIYDCVADNAIKSSISGYVDLGLYADYALSRRLTLWAQAGNLLGQTIQRHVLYSEPGRSVVAGVCFNL